MLPRTLSHGACEALGIAVLMCCARRRKLQPIGDAARVASALTSSCAGLYEQPCFWCGHALSVAAGIWLLYAVPCNVA
jgi:hypothetical protein